MPISTKVSIEIDGEKLGRFSKLTLHQELNAHHNFTLVQPMPREFVEQAVDKSQSYIGKPILITIESSFLKTEGSLLFKGIVVQSEIVREFGVSSYILIKGYSPTILLEGNPHVQSFTDRSVGDITNEVLNKYSKQQLKSSIAPKNSSSLPYTVQYNESDFSFLKRLAKKKGEWLYYNGAELFIGEPKGNSFQMDYGQNVHSLKIDMKAQPLGFSYLGYEPSSADTQTISSSELNHQEQGYTQSVFESSKKLYTESGSHLYSQPIAQSSTMPHLSDRVKTQLEGKTASLVKVYAESDEPGLRIGDKVKISEPAFSPTNNPADGIKQQYFGEYIITQITHNYDESGKYYNTFQAVPSSVQSPPYTHVQAHPHSGTQPATVTDNNDPQGLGRVKVKFPWQKMDGTPWLRMTNPHAGGGKGMYFVPEVGEEVLVGFENDNAEKPFILGAMYNGNDSSGYATGGNDNKVIQTRSGCKVIINDAQGSIHLEDPSGNTWTMDGKGNISVNAPNRISMSCTDMDINVINNKTINVGSNMTTSVGMNKTNSVGANQTETIGGMKNTAVSLDMMTMVTGKLTEVIQGDKEIQTEKKYNVNSQNSITYSSDGEVNKHSKKEVKLNSADKTKQF